MNVFFVGFFLLASSALAAGHAGCDLKKAGFKRPKEFEKFFVKLQATAAAKDESAIAKMASYPFRIGDTKRIENEADMKQKFASVFTPKVLATITSQKRNGLHCDSQGVKLGKGEVWIQEIEGVVALTAINIKP